MKYSKFIFRRYLITVIVLQRALPKKNMQHFHKIPSKFNGLLILVRHDVLKLGLNKIRTLLKIIKKKVRWNNLLIFGIIAHYGSVVEDVLHVVESTAEKNDITQKFRVRFPGSS